MIIRPQKPWFDLRLDELWHARDLIAIFVWRDFVATYKQTILGPLRYLIQPLLTTITFTVIFGNIAKLPTDGLPQFLFYMSGMTVWSYFAACLSKTSSTFTANAGLFGKVYFPRLSVPISILISNLIMFAIQFIQFLVFMLYFWFSGAAVQPNAWILLTPVLLLMMAGLGLGFGIIISSLTTRYRDLQNLVGFGVQLLMYAAPVIYPLRSAGSIPLAYPGGPNDADHREFSLCVPRRGDGRSSATGIRVRIHGGDPADWFIALQSGRAHVHGYRLKRFNVRTFSRSKVTHGNDYAI